MVSCSRTLLALAHAQANDEDMEQAAAALQVMATKLTEDQVAFGVRAVSPH